MKLLILSDVHGNLSALTAVLAAEPAADQVVFLGDAVDYGPDPAACLDLLEDRAPVRVRGNHDNAVARGLDCACSEAFHHLSVASREFTRSVLSPAQISSLGALPTERLITFGGAVFYLTHASPRDNLFDYTSPETDAQSWGEAMAGAPEAAVAMLVGHTHRPYIRALGTRVVVNPGSVGQPRDGDPRAAFAVWTDGRFELKRIAYDVELTARRLEASELDRATTDALIRVLRQGGTS